MALNLVTRAGEGILDGMDRVAIEDFQLVIKGYGISHLHLSWIASQLEERLSVSYHHSMFDVRAKDGDGSGRMIGLREGKETPVPG